jgi:hypothetical protein
MPKIGFGNDPIIPDPQWEPADNRPGREAYEDEEDD